MKKICFIFIAFFLAINVFAFDIESKSGVLINLDTKEVIDEKNKDEISSIASLTKIMTVLVAIEEADNLDQSITIDKSMIQGLVEQNAYVLWLNPGEEYSIFDLLNITMISSAADATMALVLSISKSTEEFVKLMNEKAESLNLHNTHFENPIGLDNEYNYSTPYEVAKLLEHALENKVFKKIFTEKKYYLKQKDITLKPSLEGYNNKLKLDTSSIFGSKTGFTDDAGLCLASITKKDKLGITYLLITLGGGINKYNPLHLKDAVKTYEKYLNNYKYHLVIKKGDVLTEIKTKEKKTIYIKALEDIFVFGEKNLNKSNFSFTYNGINYIDKPTKKGAVLGTIAISENGNNLKSIDVVLDKDINFYKNKIFLLLIPVMFFSFKYLFRFKTN